MHVPGFAYSRDEMKIAAVRSVRYSQLREHRGAITSSTSEYGRTIHRGIVPAGQKWTDDDIAILCDGGLSAPFGANVVRGPNGQFTCSINTD